ncbi:MAG: FecR family protein, partial [Pirellulales bacterium]|nr:FecR family protein [Pirellulales bacterium]
DVAPQPAEKRRPPRIGAPHDKLWRHDVRVGIAVAIAAVAAVLTWAAFTYLPDVAKDTGRPAAKHHDKVIAWLINTDGVAWSEGGVPASTQYRAGERLAFEKGLVAIRYATGAEVVIEGPADFTVGSNVATTMPPDDNERVERRSIANEENQFNGENRGFLELGRLVARCDTPDSKGFTVETPSGRVEDLGTEFGVEVGRDGAAEFVVLSGSVDVVSDLGDGREQRVRLVKDQGAFIASTGSQILRRADVDQRMVSAMRQRLRVNLPPAAGPDSDAPITYIDAVAGPKGNTLVTGGSLGETSWRIDSNIGVALEEQWRERPFGNGSTIYQAIHNVDDAGGDEMPELTTQISGLADGTYDVWVFYWDSTDKNEQGQQTWTIDAGLTSGSLTRYDTGEVSATGGVDGVRARSLTLSNSVETSQLSGGLTLWAAHIGQATVKSGSTINVYVDNAIGNSIGDPELTRTFYDGVGFRRVTSSVSPVSEVSD